MVWVYMVRRGVLLLESFPHNVNRYLKVECLAIVPPITSKMRKSLFLVSAAGELALMMMMMISLENIINSTKSGT